MQGFNMGRYIPPASEDPSLASSKVGGFNSQKGHPLGSRFNKAKEGITTIRFETPFDVWCETCKPEFLIKQGIRWNAQKKAVGKYLTSTIWEFSFRHLPCGGTISIKTDPENTRYVVASGGRMKAGAPTTALDKDYGEIMTAEEREMRRSDAFANLEGRNVEKVVEKTEASEIKALYDARNRRWEDPYTLNQRMRREFRSGRKEREANALEKEEVSNRYGFGFELLDHTQADADRAALIEYGTNGSSESSAQNTALIKPVFASTPVVAARQQKPPGMTKAEWKRQTITQAFRQNVVSITKARKNPFGRDDNDWTLNRKVPRLAAAHFEPIASKADLSTAPAIANSMASEAPKLVGYDNSDDESNG